MDATLLERLPEPVLLASPEGETLYGNAAFHRLAQRLGCEARLSALFGPPVAVVLAEARRNGHARAFLPLASGEPTDRGHRIEVAGGAGDGTLAVTLTDLSEEVAWRHQLFLRNSELAVLNDIGTALSTTLDIDALARRIWDQAGRILDLRRFAIALVDRERGRLEFPLWVEDGAVVPGDHSRALAHGLLEHVLAGRQPLLLDGDVAAQVAQMGLEPLPMHCASFLAVPLLSDDEAVGVLVLHDRDLPGRFGRHELGLLRIVATQAGAAIRNARLFQSARRAYHELSDAQARLLESERLRGVTETVGTLNHEVNNPLATIVGTAQLLLRRDDLDTDLRARIERMLDAAKRIQGVTGHMSTLIEAHSRPYPGQAAILDLGRSVSAATPRGTDAAPAA
jgi:GAF domain-containing protein